MKEHKCEEHRVVWDVDSYYDGSTRIIYTCSICWKKWAVWEFE